MRARLLQYVFLSVIIAGSARIVVAEDANGIRGPVVTYVFDARAQAIRPVNGILGSSTLGQPLQLPFPINAAAVAANNAFVLAVNATDGTVHLVGNLSGDLQASPIEGAIGGADRVFLNSDGSIAALLASPTRELQVVRGLPNAPIADTRIDLSSIDGTVTSLAIDRTGSNILFSVSGNPGALYLVGSSTAVPQRIANFGTPTSLALVHDDHDVIVADAAVNQLILIRDFATRGEPFLLADERDGISEPTGIAISSDGQRLFITNAATRTLEVLNLNTRTIEATSPLDAEPTRLTPVSGAGVFVLNEPGEQPLLLLDGNAGGAVLPVYFVPANRDR